MVGDLIQFKGKVTGAQSFKEIIPAVAGKIIGIKRITFTASAAGTIRLQDNATSPKSLTAIHELVAGVPLTLKYKTSDSAAKTNPGQNVNLTNSAGNVAFEGEYWLEP